MNTAGCLYPLRQVYGCVKRNWWSCSGQPPAIRAVYKSGVLKEHEAERYIRLPDGYGMDVYSLPMVVALAFRINTPCTARVRNALLERFYGRKEKQVLWMSMSIPMCEC